MGEVQGGANFNVVPESFSFTVDRRINPEEDFETGEAPTPGSESTPTSPCSRKPDPPAFPRPIPQPWRWQRQSPKCAGEPAPFELCPGILEIRFYAERGIPAFAYGPGLLSVAHGPKEFLKRRGLEDVAVVYALTAARLLSPVKGKRLTRRFYRRDPVTLARGPSGPGSREALR